MEVDVDGTIRFVLVEQDGISSIMNSFRIYDDWDRDFIPLPVDEVPLVGGQWEDSDSDGYGDNPDGPATDACPTFGGTTMERISKWGYFGCADSDWDGWANIIDDCPAEGPNNNDGDSWIDSVGCPDPDGDGWSSSGLWTTPPDLSLIHI